MENGKNLKHTYTRLPSDARSCMTQRLALMCAFATLVAFLSLLGSAHQSPPSISKLTSTSNIQSVQIHKLQPINKQTQKFIEIDEKSDVKITKHHKSTSSALQDEDDEEEDEREEEDVQDIETSAIYEFLPPLDDTDKKKEGKDNEEKEEYYTTYKEEEGGVRDYTKDSHEEEEDDDDDEYDAPPPPYPHSPIPPSSKYLEDKYHVIVTTDNTVYAQWMIQVVYYHYQKLKVADPDGPMGGFTRILHSNTTDSLMDIIPTVRVDELDPSVFVDMGYYYAPLNRPWAYVQWVKRHMHKVPERYILMAEPDHLFLSQPPLLAAPDKPMGYKFHYMQPQSFPELFVNSPRFNPTNTPLEAFMPVGNSPSIMTREDLASIAAPWYKYTKMMMKYENSRAAFGWVVEMYGFVAAAATRPQGPLKFDLIENFMCQPPVEVLHLDALGKPVEHMIHFTYRVFEGPRGVCVPEESLKVAGNNTWSFDKRTYSKMYPPRNIPLPPANCDVGVRTIIEMINEASAALPDWGKR